MANLAYIRVSSAEQNEARQHEALKQFHIDKKFIDHGVSGKSADRPQLAAMLDYMREGDTVYISEFSRLARNTKDLLTLTEDFDRQGVKLVSLKENLDTTTPTGKLMLTMIGAIAEFEREMILERQREGIAVAKKEGKYKGRQIKKISDEVFRDTYQQYINRQITKGQMAKQLEVSRPTLDRLIDSWKEDGSLSNRKTKERQNKTINNEE